ncbi:MAG: MaoC/PaaZ C-terminal domain-containing protein, partial [Myxococcota bacterium]
AMNFIFDLAKAGTMAPGLNYGFERMLHGEQYTKLERPMPTKAKLKHKAKIVDIQDKKKGALVVTEIKSYDEAGDLLVTNQIRTFVRGAGGWTSDESSSPTPAKHVPPDRAPDFVVEEPTRPDQGLLYRLSGDWNPLHADPNFAKAMQFDRPILHGLCTFGFTTRHVLSKCAPDGDVRYFESIDVRFAKAVYPGDTLVTEMWKDGTTVIFQTRVKERDEVCLSNAAVTLYASPPG